MGAKNNVWRERYDKAAGIKEAPTLLLEETVSLSSFAAELVFYKHACLAKHSFAAEGMIMWLMRLIWRGMWTWTDVSQSLKMLEQDLRLFLDRRCRR